MTRDEFKIGTLLTREVACCGFVSYCRLVAWNKQRETTIIAYENIMLLLCLFMQYNNDVEVLMLCLLLFNN